MVNASLALVVVVLQRNGSLPFQVEGRRGGRGSRGGRGGRKSCPTCSRGHPRNTPASHYEPVEFAYFSRSTRPLMEAHLYQQSVGKKLVVVQVVGDLCHTSSSTTPIGALLASWLVGISISSINHAAESHGRFQQSDESSSSSSSVRPLPATSAARQEFAGLL